MVWGWTKSHHRTHCTYNCKDLKAGLPITLEEKLSTAFVRRAFDHCVRFMNGYRYGLTGAVLKYAVKKFKSHRRLSFVTMLQTVTFLRLNEQNTEFAIEKYIAHDIKLKK